MTEEIIKRKRGRPRKNPLPIEAPAVPLPVVEIAKKNRGRPRKILLATAPVKVKKDYYVLQVVDAEFFALTTEREYFKQSVNDYKKLIKAKATPEIRWYLDKIEVVAV
jgi:hypothetical protein